MPAQVVTNEEESDEEANPVKPFLRPAQCVPTVAGGQLVVNAARCPAVEEERSFGHRIELV